MSRPWLDERGTSALPRHPAETKNCRQLGQRPMIVVGGRKRQPPSLIPGRFVILCRSSQLPSPRALTDTDSSDIPRSGTQATCPRSAPTGQRCGRPSTPQLGPARPRVPRPPRRFPQDGGGNQSRAMSWPHRRTSKSELVTTAEIEEARADADALRHPPPPLDARNGMAPFLGDRGMGRTPSRAAVLLFINYAPPNTPPLLR